MSDYHDDYCDRDDDDDYPLFSKPSVRAVLSKDDIAEMGELSRAKVARALSDGAWHETQELVRLAGHRFSTGVDELRKRGYVIAIRPKGKSFEYRCESKVEVVKVPMTFQEAYYSSAHWKAKRLERISFDGGRCCQCKTQDKLTVHHWRYDFFEERLEDLMTFCGACHQALHQQAGVRICPPEFVPPWMLEKLGVKEDDHTKRNGRASE